VGFDRVPGAVVGAEREPARPLARLQAELEAIVGTRVDLVPTADLKPEIRERAARDVVAL